MITGSEPVTYVQISITKKSKNKNILLPVPYRSSEITITGTGNAVARILIMHIYSHRYIRMILYWSTSTDTNFSTVPYRICSAKKVCHSWVNIHTYVHTIFAMYSTRYLSMKLT